MLRFITLLLLLSLSSFSVHSATDQQINALSEFGRLNAVTLHCRFQEKMRIIKRILVRILPQERELGAIFEETTQAEFLKLMNARTKCGSRVSFQQEIDLAETQLEAAFKTE